MTSIADRIGQYLREHEAEIFADLKTLVSYPSVKGTPEPDAPYGRACADVLEGAAALYRKNGFEADVFAGRGYALAYLGARPEAGTPYTGVMTHADVVPVTAADWIKTSDPFDMVDLGDLVLGRGVADDKHAVVGMLWIYRAIRDLGIGLAHGMTTFIGCEEESGMTDIRHFKQDQPLPSVAVVPDGSYPVSFGERGSFRARVVSRAALSDFTDIQGGTAYNTVLGTLTARVRKVDGLAGFLAANPREWLDVNEGEDGGLVLTARGISSHGGRPQHGESALRRFCGLLSGFGGFSAPDAAILSAAARILDDCWGECLGAAADDPDMGRLTIANGMVWCEDGHLVFTFDCRFGPSVDKQAKKDQIASALDALGFDFFPTKGGTAFRIDPQDPLAVTFLDSFRRYSGKADATYYYMSGGTYSKVLWPECPSFSTGVSYGAYASRLGLGPGHGKIHEADEVLGKAEYLRGLSILAGILTDLDRAY